MEKVEDFFIWLSGADPIIIAKCGELSHSERTKFIGYGTTVIIPAIFGCLAAGYAVSTFIPTAWVYIPAAILWFSTILAIDRMLVSTFYKSKIHAASNFYTAFIVRLCLAFILGVIVSHPLVLFIFHDSITKQIEKIHRSESIQEIKNTQSTYAEQERLLLDFEGQKECIMTLRSYEIAGGAPQEVFNKNTNKPCGKSTGKESCGPVCKHDLQTRIDDADQRISSIKKSIQTEKDRVKKSVDAVSTELNSDPTTDYIARTKALESLGFDEKGNITHIWWAEKFLMAALICIDCLMIILKATLPMGKYEIEKDRLYTEARLFSEIEKKAMEEHTASAYRSRVESKLKLKNTKSEMDEVLGSVTDFLKSNGDHIKQFDKNLSSISKNHNLGPDFKMKMRDLYREAFSKAASIINSYLKEENDAESSAPRYSKSSR